MGRHYGLIILGPIMTEYPATSLRTRILGRYYDLVSWDAIMT